LRREIESAINEKRNVVPLLFEGFKFSDPSVSKHLVGNLKRIEKYNAMNVPEDYFDAAMEKLRTRFLNKALDAVLHPVPDEVKKEVEKHKIAANEAIAQIINQGETKFSGFDVSAFKRIVQDTPKLTTNNLKTTVCAYCHKPFQLFEQRVICDFCGAQYHLGAGHSCPPMNMQGAHICVDCGQPIDASKYKLFK
jgi:hypothetical protein